MPLDGVWLVNTIQKKIRIEKGRAYAIDSWLHLLVLKVQPGMVVLKNILPAGPCEYEGEDLPLMGKLKAGVREDRSIQVSVAGSLGPASYVLIPVQLDHPQWYEQEMVSAGLIRPQIAPLGDASPEKYQPSHRPSTGIDQSRPTVVSNSDTETGTGEQTQTSQ